MQINSVLVRIKNLAFEGQTLSFVDLFGRPIQDYVQSVLGERTIVLDLDSEKELLDRLKDLEFEHDITIVMFCDTPLLRAETVKEAVETLDKQGLDAIRLARGYCFKSAILKDLTNLSTLQRYYLSDEEDFLTIADYTSFALVSETMRNRIIREHLRSGVRIIDPASTYIDSVVSIGRGVTIFPNNSLRGACNIGDNVTIDCFNVIIKSNIGVNTCVMSSRIFESTIGRNCEIGPFAHLRKGTKIGNYAKVGDFVELKNTSLGDCSKAPHHAYLGDAIIGSNCNVGAGVITANYDGTKKNQTEIADHVFVGSNSTLVAPVRLGTNAFVAAGSTITSDVDDNSLAIARQRQTEFKDKTKW